MTEALEEKVRCKKVLSMQTYIDAIIGIVGIIGIAGVIACILVSSKRIRVTINPVKAEIIFEKEERIGSITAIALYIHRLKDENDRVRLEAAIALGKLKDEAAVPALCKVLETDRNPEVRRCAAEALGEIGYTNETGSNDSNPSAEARRLAAEVLGIASSEEVGTEHRQ